MTKNRTYLIGLIAITTLLAPSAHAQLTTFAQFSQTGNTRPFTFTNTGSTSTFTLITPLEVNFYYQVVNAYNLGNYANVIPATMTLSATVAAVADDFGGTLRQQLTNLTMQFTAITPVNGQTNLLTITAAAGASGFTGGRLLGGDGGSTAGLTGFQNNSSGDTVTMTSDFVGFANATRRDYSLSFNAITPDFSINSGNGYMNSFTADGTGTFASNPAPQALLPEPTTLPLVLLGTLAFYRRRKR
jgi:hypothetical protein